MRKIILKNEQSKYIKLSTSIEYAIVEIIDRLYKETAIRKSFLRDILSISRRVFDDTVCFLIKEKIIKEIIYPRNSEDYAIYGKVKRVYLQWDSFHNENVVELYGNIREIMKVDLNSYHIQCTEYLDASDLFRLKKVIWKSELNSNGISTKQLSEIISIIKKHKTYTVGKIKYLSRSTMNFNYKRLFSLLHSEEVILYMDDAIIYAKYNLKYKVRPRFWNCENCGFRNPAKNNFCGQCGDKYCNKEA